MVVHVRPSSIATRTSTSVMVSWSPGNSMRLPASPFGPASIERRSTTESASTCTVGSFRLRTPAGSSERDRQAHPGQDGRPPQEMRIAPARSPGSPGRPGATRAPGRPARTAPAASGGPARASGAGRAPGYSAPWSRPGPLVGRGRGPGGALRGRGQQDGVLRAHRLVGLAPGLRLLIGQPCRLHVRLHLLERRHAAGNERVDEDQVPAEARLDRALPRPGLQPDDGLREPRPEVLRQLLGRAVTVVLLQHGGIAETAGTLGVDGLAGERRQCRGRVVARAHAATVGREVELAEGHPARKRERLAAAFEPRLELGAGRLVRSGHVLGKELHLLRHATPDDRVVLVEPECQRLAVQHLLLHLVLDQMPELLRRRRPVPLRLEVRLQLEQLVEGQDDLPRLRAPVAPGPKVRVDREAGRAEHEEVQEGFSQHALERPEQGSVPPPLGRGTLVREAAPASRLRDQPRLWPVRDHVSARPPPSPALRSPSAR